MVDIVLRHKDDALAPCRCVNKLCVLEILLAVHSLHILLLSTNLYERRKPVREKVVFIVFEIKALSVDSFLLYETKY